MTDPTQRARELLAAEYEADRQPNGARLIRDYHVEDLSGTEQRAIRALTKLLAREEEIRAEGWRSMESAPRDGSYFLAVVAPNRGRHLEHQAGRMFVIRHEGKTPSDYDMGWAVYPGFGGASDHDFKCWQPLPPAPRDGA